MNAVFVDSSVWIDHFRGAATPEVGALRRLLIALDPDMGENDPAHVLVGDLVLLKVLRGIRDSRQYERTRRILLAFPQVRVGGTETALAATEHFRALRREGVSVRKAVDCLIAAWCIGRRVPLLHSDRDFAPFAEHCGLRLVGCAGNASHAKI